jgi:hypothetical protein
VIGKALDKLLGKLPAWGRVTFWVIATPLIILGSIDMVRRDGFGLFLLKVIFSP